MEKILVAGADQLDPERHDLHEAARAGAGYRVLAEIAFDLDQAQHELRVEPGTPGFIMHRDQKLLARTLVGHAALELLRHGVEPRARFFHAAESQERRRLITDGLTQRGLHARRQRLVVLIACERE